MKKRILLIDHMSLFYRALYANSQLTFAGEFTGALYGVSVQIASAINELWPTITVICKDTKPYFRTIDYPEYKSNRKRETDPDIQMTVTNSLKLCDEFFQLAGLPVVELKGLEADDIIAAYAKYNFVDWEVVVASNDSDLYQLFTIPDFKIYKGKKKGLYTEKDFLNDYDVLPENWIDIIALTGGHNNLQKVPGIGDVTAVKIVKDSMFRKKKKELLVKYNDRICLNKKLARLPYMRFRNWFELDWIDPDNKYNERHLMKFLQRHGIQFTGSMRKACERLNGS